MTKKSAMLCDLERSGIVAKNIIKQIGVKQLASSEIKRLTNVEAEGYLIPYYDPSGKKTDFWRIRLTDDVARKADPNKKLRYLQPADTVPRLYFPPITDWEMINRNPDVDIVITEGEKKAIACTMQGLPCVGIGGVWSWQARKKGLRLIPDMELIQFKGRNVRIIFDSDVMLKEDVQKALNALSAELEKLGAKILITYLPQDEGKVGLDDWLLQHPVSALADLETETMSATTVLRKLNELFFMVEDIGEIYNAATITKLSRQSALNLTAIYKTITFNAAGKPVEQKALDAWLEWKQRRTYARFVYAPGQPEVLPDRSYNRWRGWGASPKRGSVDLFIKLFTHVTPELNETERRWLLEWLAYPVQHPGAKLATAVLSYGMQQGTGKTLLGQTMQCVYGDRNTATISMEHLYSEYNDWLVDKQFIVGEEITGTEKRRQADQLKALITQKTVTISKKYEHPFTLRDTANYYLTSNHLAALYMESTDRRIFVNHVNTDPLPPDFYREYERWLANGGADALMYHLLKQDVSMFNPQGQAPITEAKQVLITDAQNNAEVFVRALKYNPDEVLVDPNTRRVIKGGLFSLTMLALLFDPYGEHSVSNRRLATWLQHYGFTTKRRMNYELANRRVQETVFAVRNIDQWKKADWRAWRDHFEDVRKMMPVSTGGEKSSKIAP